MYNEILVLPFLGFNLYTKEALKQQEDKESRGLLKNGTDYPDYAGVSPHAAYDASRGKRNVANKTNELVNRTDDDDVSIEEQENKYK